MGKGPLAPMIPKVSSKGSSVRFVNRLEVFTIDGVEYIKGSPADVIAVAPSGEVSLRLFKVVPEPLCPRHKGYQAKRKPRTNCEQCWESYDGKKTFRRE